MCFKSYPTQEDLARSGQHTSGTRQGSGVGLMSLSCSQGCEPIAILSLDQYRPDSSDVTIQPATDHFRLASCAPDIYQPVRAFQAASKCRLQIQFS